MEVTEVAARLVRRYWLVLLMALVLPVIGVGAFAATRPLTYTAHARIVAGVATPRAQAEAVAVVSQVQALATSRDLVVQALDGAHLTRDPDKVIASVSATGLGSSALVELAYTDRDAAMAARVLTALATAVVTRLDAVRIGGLPEVLKAVDNQLTELATKRAPLAADAQNNPKDLVALNRLSGIDRLISDLSGDRNRLSEDAAAAGHATVVATPVTPQHADPRGLPAKLAVAALLGLVLGLIAVGANETLRPSVSGAARVARLLEVPVLGALGSDPATLADLGRRIRLAARRASVSSVVLVRANRAGLPPELVDRIAGATLRPDPVARRIAIPIDMDETRILSGPMAGRRIDGEPAPDGRESGSVAVLTATENSGRPGRLHQVCSLDELDPSAESEHIGLVVLVAGSTRLRAVDGVRDLMTAAGWPLLGVLGDNGRRGGRR